MPAPDDRNDDRNPEDRSREPLHPAVLSALLADGERVRERSGRRAHAVARSRHRHRALIRLVVGVLLIAALITFWRLLS